MKVSTEVLFPLSRSAFKKTSEHPLRLFIPEIMNEVLESIYQHRQVETRNGKQLRLTDGVDRNVVKFLQEIVGELRPPVSLEVGMAYGISSLAICEVLADQEVARHIVVDPFQNRPGPWGASWEGIGLYNLERAGYQSFVEFLEEPSFFALPRLAQQGVRVDFAFIDGMHTFDYVLNDFFYVDKLLSIGGVVAFDDVNWPSVRKALRYILTNRSYEVVETSESVGRPPSWKQRLARQVGRVVPQTRLLFKEEYVQHDLDLGITRSRGVALKKIAEDTRSEDVHVAF